MTGATPRRDKIMIRKLYLQDSYLSDFEAAVKGCEKKPDGDGSWLVSLEKTAFYPESGGQRADKGTINGFPVVHVFNVEGDKKAGKDEEIFHVVETGKPISGQVKCSIDMEHRLSNMRQHTGQHILSRCFSNLCDADTVSSRLGAAECTVDIDLPKLSVERLADVEHDANRVVRENLPVTARNLSSPKARALPLRKMPDMKGRIRVVEIKEFDWSACGGTHVAHTGEIGHILITGTEKYKGLIRVFFVTGINATARAAAWRAGITAAKKKLSCGLDDIPANYLKMQAEIKSHIRANNNLIEKLAALQLVKIRGELGKKPSVNIIDWGDVNILRRLAIAALEEKDGSVILVHESEPSTFVVAANGGKQPDLLPFLDHLCSSFGCRGGGDPGLVQGTGLEKKRVAEFVETARKALAGKPVS